MIIKGLSIDGFGLFHDVEVRDLPAGLSVFIGDNEAGKSTTMAFVHTVLFGYPDGRSSENAYPPLQGGQPGGRLLLASQEDGAVTVERRGGPKGGPLAVQFEDGRSEGQAALTRLLGGVTRTLFRKLYGFDLSELDKMGSLSDESVRDVIYGASLGSTTNTLPEVRRRLEDKKSGLFAARGQKPRINVLLRELEEVREQLREARRGIVDYEKLAKDLDEVEEQIEQARNRLHEGRAHAQRIQSHLQLWDDWTALLETERRLADLQPIVEDFPVDGLVRLDALGQEMKAEEASLRGLKEDLQEKYAQLERIAFDVKLLNQDSAVRALVRGLGAYEKSRSELPRAQENLKRAGRQAEGVREEFGANRSEKWVLALDRSSIARGQIEDHLALLEVAHRGAVKGHDAQQQAEEERDSLLVAQQTARERVEQLEIGLPAEIPSDTMDALRERRTQFQDVLRDLPKVEQQRRDADETLAAALREISPTWTPETLGRFDASLTSRQRVTEADNRMTDQAARVREAGLGLHRGEEGLAGAVRAVESRKAALESASAEVTSVEVLRERKVTIRELREAVQQRDAVVTELRFRRQVAEQAQAGPTSDGAARMSWRAKIGAAVVAVLAPAAGGVLWVQAGVSVGVGTAIVLLLIAAFLYLVARSAAGVVVAPSPGALREVDTTQDGLAQKGERLAVTVADLREKLGASGEVTPAQVDELEDENTRQLESAAELVRLRRELEEAQTVCERAADDREAAVAALEKEKADQRAAAAEWQGVLEALHLPDATSPRTAAEVFTKAEVARGLVRQMAEYDDRLADMGEARREYLELMQSVPTLDAVTEGLEDVELLNSLAEFLADVVRQEDQRRQLAEAAKATRRAEEELDAAMKKVQSMAIDHEQAAAGDQEAQDSWKAWLVARGMEETWSPATVLRLLERAGRLAELAADRDEVVETIERLAKEIEAYQTRVVDLCRALGRSEPTEDKLVTEVYALEKELTEALGQRTLHKALAEEIPELERRCTGCLSRLEVLGAGMCELLEKGEARDEEEFRTRGKLHDERQKLLQALGTHEERVKRGAGETDPDALREALKEESLPGLQVAAAEAEDEVAAADAGLTELQAQRARYDERRKQLQNEDGIARLRAREEGLLESFRELSEDWARHAVALHLLSAAKDRFEQTHQPDVIRRASGYFDRITDGKYAQVFAPHGEQTVEVVDHRERRVGVENLSRGTSEQLYLAIRFGYIASQDERRERLPLLMDDVMVNFDPTRARQAAGGILEMAETHQVLFFTCHPEGVQVFRDQQPDVPVYRIDGGAIERAA